MIERLRRFLSATGRQVESSHFVMQVCDIALSPDSPRILPPALFSVLESLSVLLKSFVRLTKADEDPTQLGKTRKEIARIKTLLRERQIAQTTTAQAAAK